MKPPQILKTSITNSSAAEDTVVDGSEAMTSDSSLLWGNDSTYEILRREGELHEGRATVLDELQRNFARLEDLHGQLHFMLREVESLLRTRS
jgi:hypothetical protein